MNNGRDEKCASCKEFPLPDAIASGRARCAMFDQERAWDSGACIHYSRAGDIKERGTIVRQIIKKGVS